MNMRNKDPKFDRSQPIEVEYIELGDGNSNEDQWIKLGYLFESISKEVKRSPRNAKNRLNEFYEWCENMEASTAAKELMAEISWRPKGVDNYFSKTIAKQPEAFAGYWLALKRDDLLRANNDHSRLLDATYSQIRDTLLAHSTPASERHIENINDDELSRSEQLQSILSLVRQFNLT